MNIHSFEPHVLRNQFLEEVADSSDHQLLVIAVKLPQGSIEVITNSQNIQDKIDYYIEAYDHEFKLRQNPDEQIVGFLLICGETEPTVNELKWPAHGSKHILKNWK